MTSFEKLASETGHILSNPSIDANKKRGAPAVSLADVPMVPLFPIDAELQERLNLQESNQLLATFVDGDIDVKSGYTLQLEKNTVVTDYPIKVVQDWPWRGSIRKMLVVENIL